MRLPHPHPFFSQRALCSEKLKDSDSRSQIQDRKAPLCSRGRFVGTQTVDTFFVHELLETIYIEGCLFLDKHQQRSLEEWGGGLFCI